MRNSYLVIGTLAAATLFSTSFTQSGNQPIHSTSKVALGTGTVVAVNTLPVNTASSTLTWNAKKVGGEHSGTVKLSKGSLDINKNKLVGGSFVIDMTTIDNTDVTMEGMKQKLVGHLKNDDFFAVDKHPTATFKITKVVPVAKAKAGEPNYTITGDMTIKGITHAVTFPATVKVAGNTAEANATITLDRTKWDVKYRSGLIETAADKVIDDNFTIDLKLVAGANS